MNYQRNWVLAAYRAEHPTRRNPTVQILEAFDQTLAARFEAEIVSQAVATIPLNPFNRSILMYFASRSDTVTPATQVRHAYEFFRNTLPTP
jgi:uncharacterized protein YecE (DUF72 family)